MILRCESGPRRGGSAHFGGLVGTVISASGARMRVRRCRSRGLERGEHSGHGPSRTAATTSWMGTVMRTVAASALASARREPGPGMAPVRHPSAPLRHRRLKSKGVSSIAQTMRKLSRNIGLAFDYLRMRRNSCAARDA